MQISYLPTIPQAPANDDVLMIEVNGITYKVSKQALAEAIAANITPENIGALPVRPGAIELSPVSGATNGGYIDFHFGGQETDYTARIIELVEGILHISGGLTLGAALGVSSGGTGATTAYDAAENLGLSLAMNGTNWTLATMYSKMSKVPITGSALLWLSPTAIGLLSGGKVTTYCTVVASRENASDWRFMAFHASDAYVHVWHITGWTSASATPTIGTIYKFTSNGELVLSSQTVDANGNINTGLDAGTYVVASARCSSYIITPWVSGNTTTWWLHLTTFTGAAVSDGTNVGTVRVYYYNA